MPKRKFDLALVKKILMMKHNGYKYSEIGKELNLTSKQVENICTRYRISEMKNAEKKAASKEKEPNFPVELKVGDVVLGTITPAKVDEPEKKEVVKPEKTLNDFSVREILKFLYEKGYRIENNSLYCLIKKPVQLNEILGL